MTSTLELTRALNQVTVKLDWTRPLDEFCVQPFPRHYGNSLLQIGRLTADIRELKRFRAKGDRPVADVGYLVSIRSSESQGWSSQKWLPLACWRLIMRWRGTGAPRIRAQRSRRMLGLFAT